MRVLVTGGAGFIGSHLVEKLLASGHEVVILDDFNDFYDPQTKHANIAGLARDVTIYHVDLRDSELVRNLFHREKVDAIAHLAARAGVRPSIQQPRLYYDTNVTGTLHLLEAARVTGVERFVFASSSSVYGRFAISLFTGRANGRIWPFINSRGAFTPGNPSINLGTAARAAITLTLTT